MNYFPTLTSYSVILLSCNNPQDIHNKNIKRKLKEMNSQINYAMQWKYRAGGTSNLLNLAKSCHTIKPKLLWMMSIFRCNLSFLPQVSIALSIISTKANLVLLCTIIENKWMLQWFYLIISGKSALNFLWICNCFSCRGNGWNQTLLCLCKQHDYMIVKKPTDQNVFVTKM